MSSREGSDEELLFDGRENIRPQVLALNVETQNDRVSLPEFLMWGQDTNESSSPCRSSDVQLVRTCQY